MKRLGILILAAAALLAGCAGFQASHLSAAPAASSVAVVATLATNECEAATAADYTGVIVARRQAARLLRLQQISIATAVAVQRLADDARAALDGACPNGRTNPEAIATARAARLQLAKLLEAPHAN